MSRARTPSAATSGKPRRDFTSTIPRERQLVRKRRFRVPLTLLAVAIVAALAAAVFVLPVRDWWRQGDDLGQREQELVTLQEVNTRLQTEIDRLQTPAGVAEAAREELGMVEPGERRLSLVDRGNQPSALPAGWPYSVVTGIVGARTNVVSLAPVTPPSEQ